MELTGLDQGDTSPEGAIFHWVVATDNGIVVAETQIGPYSQRVGLPAPPTVTRYEVHNTLVGDAATAHPGSFAR